jgi:ComF family protein
MNAPSPRLPNVLSTTLSTAWRGVLTPLAQVTLDAIFPPRCAGCRTWSRPLFCPACRATLTPLAPPFCAVCGKPFDPLAHSAAECADCRANRYHPAPPFQAMRSVYAFENAMRHAVHRFKYNGKIALAAPLAGLLHDYLRHPPEAGHEEKDAVPAIPVAGLALLTPVPLHPWRRYRRGYNQSALLARELSRGLARSGDPVAVGEVLRRTRHTPPQVGLTAKDRVENVAGAFAIDAARLEQLNPQRGPVLLLDDVCTTGSTLRECAAVLRKAGVKEVYALTLARHWRRASDPVHVMAVRPRP